MKRNKLAAIFVATVAVLILTGASTAFAWQPSGWVYHNGDYAYSTGTSGWHYFNPADEQWRVNLNTDAWGTLDDAAGWTYYNWPYAYSSSAGAWFWHNQGDEQWCCRLSSGVWSVFGVQTVAEEMVYVEGGSFTMGDTWGDGLSDELPTHSVTVSSFYMSKYEVTNDEMAEVLNWAEDRSKLDVDSSSVHNANGDSQKLFALVYSSCQISWNGSAFVVNPGKGDYPCVEVSWYGAAAYCNYRSEKDGLTACYDLSDWSCNWSANGYRLPTEAEWEYVAKGGRNGSYTKYSGSDDPDSVAWYDENSDASGNSGFYNGKGTLPVGTKANNELGIHDMSGNVWEWCNDWYADYSSESQTNPTGPGSELSRVLRGGSWFSDASYCRVAFRFGGHPLNTLDDFGFRCVR